MTSPSSSDPSQVRFDWLDTYAPASLPYMIGFSIFVPFILGANIGLEFWLAKPAYWALTVQQGLLNAGTMSTWGIPLTIILTEWITRMLARHFIARREKAASDRYTKVQRDLDAQQKDLDAKQKDLHIQREDLDVQQKDLDVQREDLENSRQIQLAWYEEALARWEETKARTEAEGREFTALPPVPPPDVNGNKKG